MYCTLNESHIILAPCILLLEDIENLCPKLTINSPAHITRISSQLLKLLDDALCEPTLLIIATTNNVSLLHMGLRRSGRLDVEVIFFLIFFVHSV